MPINIVDILDKTYQMWQVSSSIYEMLINLKLFICSGNKRDKRS